MGISRRSGRRPGKPDTREQILAAAREVFAADGYDRSSMRRIASVAGVDAALVHHYFGTKEKLFLAAVEAPFDPTEIIPGAFAGDFDHLGERVVRTFIGVWEAPSGVRAAAFLRSAINHPTMSKLIKQFFLNHIVKAAFAQVPYEVDNIQLRANFVASQLFGLAITRYILKFEPLASLSPDTLVQVYGPTLQRYVTMDVAKLEVDTTD